MDRLEAGKIAPARGRGELVLGPAGKRQRHLAVEGCRRLHADAARQRQHLDRIFDIAGAAVIDRRQFAKHHPDAAELAAAGNLVARQRRRRVELGRHEARIGDQLGRRRRGRHRQRLAALSGRFERRLGRVPQRRGGRRIGSRRQAGREAAILGRDLRRQRHRPRPRPRFPPAVRRRRRPPRQAAARHCPPGAGQRRRSRRQARAARRPPPSWPRRRRTDAPVPHRPSRRPPVRPPPARQRRMRVSPRARPFDRRPGNGAESLRPASAVLTSCPWHGV